MRKFLDRLYLWAGYLAGVFLILVFAIMLFMSAGRSFGVNIPAGDDIAAWSMAACSFLGLAHTFKAGDMIRVGLLTDRLTRFVRLRWTIEVLSLALGVVFIAYFAFNAGKLAYDSYRFNDLAQGVLPVPLWIPQLGFVGGLAILTIAFLDELIIVLRGGRATYEKDPPKTAEEVIERAIAGGV